MQEDKYVLRHEWIDSNGKIREKINENEIRHTKEISELNNKVDRQTTIQHQSFNEQKETNQNLKDLTQVMTNVGNEMTEIKYTVKGHDEKLTLFKAQLIQNKKEVYKSLLQQ